MPGDYDIEYASPWAGANYMPVSVKGTQASEWDRNTWGPLEDLARNHPEAGVHFQRMDRYLLTIALLRLVRDRDIQPEKGRRLCNSKLVR